MTEWWAGEADSNVASSGRFSRVPAVEAALSAYGRDWLEPAPQRPDADPELLVDSDDLDVLNQELDAAGQPHAVAVITDFGRGASWDAVVVQILVALATVGGAADAVILGAGLIKRAHRRASRRIGHAASISLGAAEYLAGLDLITRTTAASITTMGATGIGVTPDRSFVGADAYWIAFTTNIDGDIHHYQVSATAEVHYLGAGPRIPNWMEDRPPPPDDDDDR